MCWLVALQRPRGQCPSPDAPWGSPWFTVSPKGCALKTETNVYHSSPDEGHSCAVLALGISPSRAALEKAWPSRQPGRGSGGASMAPLGSGHTLLGRGHGRGKLLPTHLPPKSWQATAASGKLGLDEDAQWGLLPLPPPDPIHPTASASCTMLGLQPRGAEPELPLL